MATTNTQYADLLGVGQITRQTVLNATATKNIRGGACRAYGMMIDNSANASVVYVKLYDALNPTVGTTDPDFVFKIAASAKVPILLNPRDDEDNGIAFTVALTAACVTAGGTAGTSSPGSSVPVDFFTN